MFGKQFLSPDRPPVFNTPEITHDDELIETTDLLVHGVDLLNDLCWRTDEGETRVEDLFIRHRAKLLDDSTGVEGEAFCPRIRGLHHQWIYRIDPQKAYGPLTPLVSQPKRTLHLDWITAHWDRMGQFFASFAAGETTASVAPKRLLARGPPNHFYRAGRGHRRVFEPLLLLHFLSDPPPRPPARPRS